MDFSCNPSNRISPVTAPPSRHRLPLLSDKTHSIRCINLSPQNSSYDVLHLSLLLNLMPPLSHKKSPAHQSVGDFSLLLVCIHFPKAALRPPGTIRKALQLTSSRPSWQPSFPSSPYPSFSCPDPDRRKQRPRSRRPAGHRRWSRACRRTLP